MCEAAASAAGAKSDISSALNDVRVEMRTLSLLILESQAESIIKQHEAYAVGAILIA